MRSLNLVPVSNHIVVKRNDADTVTPGGIVIPDNARQEKPSRGKVLAVGPGSSSWVNGELKYTPVVVAEGQSILFAKYGGQEVEIDGEKLTIIKDDDVIAIIGQ